MSVLSVVGNTPMVELTRDKIVLERTRGNTEIAIAMIGAAKGYRVKLTLPACVSTERQHASALMIACPELVEGPFVGLSALALAVADRG